MNKTHLYILTTLLLSSLMSCKKDNPDQIPALATLQVEFQVTNHTTPVGLNTPIQLTDGRQITILELKYYISHLKFLHQNTETNPREPVLALIQHLEPGKNSLTLQIAPGTFSGLKFYPGLDSITNNSNPVDFPREHPLSAFFNMHWNWNLKYRFVLMEFRALDYTPPIPCSFHPGTNQLLTTTILPFQQEQVLQAGKSYKLTIALDLNKLFDGPSGYIDFETENQAHADPGDFELTKKFMENFAAAFQIAYFTPLPQ
ncbi:MbnP family protein [Schleiferia thermophila]|jgi:hypothetical protein|uniref:Copper-binding protein MbnP-like domain-containing protein n=1 Tax=Schleiferia thermophila TaxID=884107 RepID=A0A369A1C1_9FLAO|nr:MbnP family protein [Schleiferia thermophila]RCX02146.1 hypothetical protein DES35_105117 [Schleiferia thermophila]GCD80667.1 hypothetical protein JCM30197_19140 [Schleiferia thermophila]